MNKGKYVFALLLDFIDKDLFLRIADKYNGNKYVKHFTCWNQLAVLMFGHLSNRESLRDVVLATQAHWTQAYHLGFGKAVTKSNLSKANSNRDYRIFEEFAYRVIAKARECRATEIFQLGGNIYAFDSSTIELCLSVIEWALFRRKKGGIKIHKLYDIETQIPTFFHITPAKVHDVKAMDKIPYKRDSFYIFDRAYNDFHRLHNIENVDAYFVVRVKKNNDFKPEVWTRHFLKNSGIRSDSIGHMSGYFMKEKYPDTLRRVVYFDEETQRTFIFFTNALDLSSVTIARLYKNRWQIEMSSSG